MSAACAFNIVLSVPAHSQYAESSLKSCLRFEDVLKFSAQRDPDVVIARAQERAADADITDAKSLFRPQISAFGRSGFGDTGVIDSSISNQVGIRASQRVIDFGDSKYAKQAANFGYEASLEDTRQAQYQAALQTGLFYLEWIEADQQIEITKRRRDYFARQLESIDRLLAKGAATRTERASVASQLANADAFVLEIQFRKEQALTQVQIDTGSRSQLCTGQSTEALLATQFKTLQGPETASQFALSHNPYSSIGGFDQFEFRDRIGVDVSVPLYSGNALGARNQRAAARQSIARGRVLDAQRQLRKDVSITYRRILSLQSQYERRLDVEEQTRLQFEAAESEQDFGTKTLRDLIEIRLEFEQASLETIRTKYDLMRQELQLLTLTSKISVFT